MALLAAALGAGGVIFLVAWLAIGSLAEDGIHPDYWPRWIAFASGAAGAVAAVATLLLLEWRTRA